MVDPGQGSSGEGPEESLEDGQQHEGQDLPGEAVRGQHDHLGDKEEQGGHDPSVQDNVRTR